MAHNAVVTVVVIAEPIVSTPFLTIEWHRTACTGCAVSLVRGKHAPTFRRQLAAQQVRASEQSAVAHQHLRSHGHTSDDAARLCASAGQPTTTITREAAP
jgi:hypothetical protein